MKIYLKHRTEVTKLYTVYIFRQSTWPAKFNRLKTGRRAEENIKFEIFLYELLMKPLYG